MGISGISSGFPLLSRSSGQVAHVLLTRSPLGLHQGLPLGWTSFDLHVLSTPPAFVLSQDQTLHRDHAPGEPENDPLKSRRQRALTRSADWHQDGQAFVVVRCSQCIRLLRQAPRCDTENPSPALALVPLFRFQRAHRRRARVVETTLVPSTGSGRDRVPDGAVLTWMLRGRKPPSERLLTVSLG